MKNLIFCLLFTCIAMGTANAQWWQGSKKIEGNGKMISSSRNVPEYDGVALTGSMTVELVSGTEGKLQIEAEENLIQYITTKIKGRQLEVSVENGYNLRPGKNKGIKIIVPFEDLDKLSVTGSGDIKALDAIRAENFRINVTGSGEIQLPLQAKNTRAGITGSGDISLSGSSENFRCEITGSGDISAFDFKCKYVDADITGSGDIRVFASEELKARVPGSGDIEYRGNPKKEDFKTMGSGSVTKK